MSDVILSDGREITFDLGKLTHGEYRGLFDPKEPDKKSDETIARVSGITAKELDALLHNDYRLLTQAFFRKCREPLAEPKNSGSAPS